ncbi:Mu transposase C-terminal domain-containing protein [Frankia sp. Cas3]|uniref:Mu transposase C-terminal domain-containing protein n=1 Tax=Frankia sp. Cas3 TaxID=3073926 RepID=UPI003A0FF65D
MLGDYVGEPVTIRYDPRDVAEIRVFHNDRLLAVHRWHRTRTRTRTRPGPPRRRSSATGRSERWRTPTRAPRTRSNSGRPRRRPSH